MGRHLLVDHLARWATGGLGGRNAVGRFCAHVSGGCAPGIHGLLEQKVVEEEVDMANGECKQEEVIDFVPGGKSRTGSQRGPVLGALSESKDQLGGRQVYVSTRPLTTNLISGRVRLAYQGMLTPAHT